MNTPQELLTSTKCFACYGLSQYELFVLGFLGEIADNTGGGSASCRNLEGADPDPNGIVTPEFVGQVYVTSGVVWQAGSLLNNSWVEICTDTPTDIVILDSTGGFSFIGLGSLTSISAPNLTDSGTGNYNIEVRSCHGVVSIGLPVLDTCESITLVDLDLISINLPLLASIETNLSITDNLNLTSISVPLANTTTGGSVDLSNNPSLTSLNMNSLATIAGGFYMVADSAITSVSLPALVNVGGEFNLSNCSGMTSLSVPLLATVAVGFSVTFCTSLTSLAAPSLVTITGDFNSAGCTSMVTLNLNSLTTVGGQFVAQGSTALTSIDIDNVLTIGSTIACSNCTSLVTVALSTWNPTDGTTITFNNCALNIATMNAILIALDGALVTTCTVDLSGGTNAGLTTLSAGAQTAYANLVIAGNTMSINP